MAGFARSILQLYYDMNRSMLDMAATPKIHVGATITIGQSLLAPVVQKFETENKCVTVEVVIDNTAAMEALLMEGQIDIAFVEGRVEREELLVTPLVQDKMVLICPKNHALLQQKKVLLQDVLGFPLLVREEGSGTRDLLQKELVQRGIHPTIKWTAHSFDAIICAVLAEQGVTVASELIAKRHIQHSELAYIAIADALLTRDFSLVHHKNKAITDTMKKLAEYFKESQCEPI